MIFRQFVFLFISLIYELYIHDYRVILREEIYGKNVLAVLIVFMIFRQFFFFISLIYKSNDFKRNSNSRSERFMAVFNCFFSCTFRIYNIPPFFFISLLQESDFEREVRIYDKWVFLIILIVFFKNLVFRIYDISNCRLYESDNLKKEVRIHDKNVFNCFQLLL